MKQSLWNVAPTPEKILVINNTYLPLSESCHMRNNSANMGWLALTFSPDWRLCCKTGVFCTADVEPSKVDKQQCLLCSWLSKTNIKPL